MNVKEVLWNFSRFKDERRVRLKQNPRFYEVLPTSAKEYEGGLQIKPTDLETDRSDPVVKIDVLTDESGPAGRVYLEIDKEKRRAFGNVWALKKAIIFKGLSLFYLLFSPSDILSDVCGNLEGEKHVWKAFEGVQKLWCFKEPPLSPTSRSPNPSNPSSTMTPTTSPTLLDGNCTEQIRRMLLSRDCNVNIRISSSDSAKPSLSRLARPGYSAPSRSSSAGSPLQSQSPTVAPLPTHPTVTPASITAAPTHATPLQSPKVALRQITTEPARIRSISPGEVSSISGHTSPPQAVYAAGSPSGLVNISTAEVMDPTLPRAERDEALVARQISRKSHDSGFVPSPVRTSPVPSPIPAPVVPSPIPTRVVTTPVPNPVVPTPVRNPIVPTPATHVPTPVRNPAVPIHVRTPVVPTPMPAPVPAKVKRSWYQKCVDVVKIGLRVG